MNISQVAPIVEQTCKEFNVQYVNKPSYWEALDSYYKFMKNLAQEPKCEKSK